MEHSSPGPLHCCPSLSSHPVLTRPSFWLSHSLQNVIAYSGRDLSSRYCSWVRRIKENGESNGFLTLFIHFYLLSIFLKLYEVQHLFLVLQAAYWSSLICEDSIARVLVIVFIRTDKLIKIQNITFILKGCKKVMQTQGNERKLSGYDNYKPINCTVVNRILSGKTDVSLHLSFVVSVSALKNMSFFSFFCFPPNNTFVSTLKVLALFEVFFYVFKRVLLPPQNTPLVVLRKHLLCNWWYVSEDILEKYCSHLLYRLIFYSTIL